MSFPTPVPVDALLAIFRWVLETDDVSPSTNFFEAGGDSLLATRVLSLVARDHGVELGFDEFVCHADPAALAGLVGRLLSGEPAGSPS
ncbi:MAG: acyl carrier protein [Nocardioides sp.]